MSELFVYALQAALAAHDDPDGKWAGPEHPRHTILRCGCGWRSEPIAQGEDGLDQWRDHRALAIQQAVYDYLSEDRLARAICAARKPVLADADDPDLFVDDECKHIALFTRSAFLT